MRDPALLLCHTPQTSLAEGGTPSWSFPKLRLAQSNPAVNLVREDTTPKIMLSSSWDTYINGLPRHDRHELRRKMKNFASTQATSAFL